MPKDRRNRSLDRSKLSPFPRRSTSKQSLPQNPLENDKNRKQWEDARCPVCIEHPHNSILLICASHEKGCRPFMCDTSYRHSNCFDQFRKSFTDMQIPEDAQNASSVFTPVSNILPEASVSDPENPTESKLICPLCRGPINGWVVVESARRYMNAKTRNCASEMCDYSGTYKDLRKHARLVHPLVRPADVNPERQHNWRRLERQRDFGDLLSTLQWSMGEDRGEGSTLTIDEGGWLTVFFLVRIIAPGRNSNRSTDNNNSSRPDLGRLWGETYDREPDSGGDDEDEESLMHSVPRRHVGRRFGRNRDTR